MGRLKLLNRPRFEARRAAIITKTSPLPYGDVMTRRERARILSMGERKRCPAGPRRWASA
jgi:hypothetical protein